MLEALILVIGIALLWKGSSYLTSWFEQAEESLKADVAESSVETAKQVQKTNEKLNALLEEYDNELVSADSIIERAKGK